MIALLQSKDSQIRAMQIRKVGSLYSDLRVGRPYEADILLISERNTKRLTSRLLFETVEKMVPDLNRELADTHWKIVAVYEHQVGIAMAVVALDGSEKPVGLLIDLVLMGSEFQSIKHEISKSYLKALDKIIESKTHGERSDLVRYMGARRNFSRGGQNHRRLKKLTRFRRAVQNMTIFRRAYGANENFCFLRHLNRLNHRVSMARAKI